MDTARPQRQNHQASQVTGDAVRNAYYELMAFFYPNYHGSPKYVAKWDGGYDFYGKRHERVWDKIANFLNRKNCTDVYGFIRANILVHFKDCYPNKLYSERAWENYQNYLRSCKDEIKYHIKSQLDLFFAKVNFYSASLGDKAVEAVILDKSNDFSPIIRCYLVWKFGIPPLKLPESVWKSGRLQYLTAKSVYDSFLPDLGQLFT
ncbi:MAG: hypothetical protein KatS3mg087_0030 [Patescibacteria group bacterium]|nr:MAG: hypothetical protein KatS3mg087_0030 [Patescibacteria group bacterium]